MKITLLTPTSLPPAEDYSEYDPDDMISIFSSVCEAIDQHSLARFTILFDRYDQRFSRPQFMYDFTSIVPEVFSKLAFLDKKEGEDELFFYELDRRILLKFVDQHLKFDIVSANRDEILAQEIIIDCQELKDSITDMLQTFKQLLTLYFPQALAAFEREQYIFNEQ